MSKLRLDRLHREAAYLAEGQRLMMLGYWHQQDSDTLRCKHGFKNKSRCPGCCGFHEYPEVIHVK